MPEPRIVVVGGGIAAVTAVRTLRGLGFGGELELVGEEAHVPYDRPPLSKQVLSGRMSESDSVLLKPPDVVELDVALRLGHKAVGLDVPRRQIRLDDDTRIDYDGLLIATGARARVVPDFGPSGVVHYLRTRDDAVRLRDAIASGGHLAVVGGGFIGLEVAASARQAGLRVTVVEGDVSPLARVLGKGAGLSIAALHEHRGVQFHFSRAVQAIKSTPACCRIICSDGHEFDADFVVVGIGAVPNTEWLSESGVEVADGVVCDESGRTNVPGIYAAGDGSRWRNGFTGSQSRLEQWTPAIEQARIASTNLLNELRGATSFEAWSSVPYFWSDQYDHKIQMCGGPGPLFAQRPLGSGFVACFGDVSGLTGVLTLDNPVALARGRRLVSQGGGWEDAAEWLNSLET